MAKPVKKAKKKAKLVAKKKAKTWRLNDKYEVREGEILKKGSVTETEPVYHITDDDGSYLAQATDLGEDMDIQAEKAEERKNDPNFLKNGKRGNQ